MPLARGTERASHITALISSVAALAQVCNFILTITYFMSFVVPSPQMRAYQSPAFPALP